MIIIGGNEIETPGVLSVNYKEHGMVLPAPNTPPRRKHITWCVLHWTASERVGEDGARKMFTHHKQAGLSVEWMITNEGTIWQFFDPLVSRGKHASRVNPFSVGVEVSAVGHAKPGRELSARSAQRESYVDTVQGWTTTWLDYLEAQHASMAVLADVLIEQCILKPYVMLAPFERRLTKDFKARSGFCGHLHAASFKVKHPKCDPGTRPLIRLNEHFVEKYPNYPREDKP
jgi:N-acetyl-anhydromuramyl-L-alanine amidase AmpD